MVASLALSILLAASSILSLALRGERLRRMAMILSVALALSILALSSSQAHCQQVEVPPQWRAGPLAVYLFSFPEDGGEYRGSVTIALAVWNARPEDSIRILLDGEEAAVIDHEGYFTYTWKLRGSHHVAVVCRYKIFAQASFWVKPPPPRPVMIPLSEFYERMKRERERMTFIMVGSTALGVPLGIWTKKKTRIRSEWALLLPAAALILGLWRLDTLYMLLPLGVAWALTYILAREYANYLGVFIIQVGLVEKIELALDEGNYAILGVGPRYWRSWFIKRYKVEIREARDTFTFTSKGVVIRCVAVRGYENYQVDDKKKLIRIRADPALSRVLKESEAVEWLQNKVADLEFKTLLTERALRALVAHVIGSFERIVRDLLIDKVKTPEELRRRISEAQEKLRREFEEAPAGPVEGAGTPPVSAEPIGGETR